MNEKGEPKSNAYPERRNEAIGPKTKRFIVVSVILFFIAVVGGNILSNYIQLWLVILCALIFVFAVSSPFAVAAYRETRADSNPQ